jgi:hypothetical protein
VSYRADSGKFAATPLGWILHVVVGNGSPWATFEGAVSPARRFSTGWVAKDGRGEQFTELECIPWAQAAGNPKYWAFETEGYPSEPLTDAQVETLAKWHNFLHTADRLAETPGAAGVGTHYMGGVTWGGHTCPDPQAGAGPRSKQRAAIIARAIALRNPQEDDMLTPEAQTWIQARMTAHDQWIVQNLRAAIAAAKTDPAALAKALAAALPANGTVVTQAELEAALRTVLGSVDGKVLT